MIREIKPRRNPRIDGPLKVCGAAKYSSDHHFPGMAYAVPICATIGKGRVLKIDVASVSKMPGIITVITHENVGLLYRIIPSGFDLRYDEGRNPLEDNTISYYGQFVGLVVAESFEVAQAAARSIPVEYQSEKPDLNNDYLGTASIETESKRGDPAGAFRSAAAKVDQVYTTPVEVHSPIELHATVAVWDRADQVTIYETSQAISTHQNVVAAMLGLPRENVRVITRFLGSGFGGKLWPWSHSVLAALAARQIHRPVKLVIDRHMGFTNVGHRPRTQQRVRMAADPAGRLQALIHEYASQISIHGEYKENCGEVSGFLYNIPNVEISSARVKRNMSPPTSMRGPGAVPGLFAIESALDELAVQLKMDPLEIRLLNDTLVDLSSGKKFSSRHLKECLELGAEKFGWSNRNPAIGSMRDGDEILGWGVASCTWQSRRLDADANFKFLPNGQVMLSCGTTDLGTGMYTVLAQLVSDETGLPFSRIEVQLGDTKLPKGPLAGGSMATGSVVPAVLAAVRDATRKLKEAAVTANGSPLKGKPPESVSFSKGNLAGFEFGELLKKMNLNVVEGSASVKGSPDAKSAEFSTKSFGAQFIEVGWNPGLARLRVRRVVTAIDAGRIINFRQGRNQIEGAVVMGIGMAMLEEGLYDHRDGNMVNNNFADYVMAVHADCPDMQCVFLDYPDTYANEYGARGIGEIGLAGVASAITSAVYHATGKRIRDLPVTIEKLLG